MKDYRETLIRIDHEAKTCEVWTERRGVISRAKRCGFKELKRQALGVWLTGHARQVLLRAMPGSSGRKHAAGRPFSSNQRHS